MKFQLTGSWFGSRASTRILMCSPAGADQSMLGVCTVAHDREHPSAENLQAMVRTVPPSDARGTPVPASHQLLVLGDLILEDTQAWRPDRGSRWRRAAMYWSCRTLQRIRPRLLHHFRYHPRLDRDPGVRMGHQLCRVFRCSPTARRGTREIWGSAGFRDAGAMGVCSWRASVVGSPDRFERSSEQPAPSWHGRSARVSPVSRVCASCSRMYYSTDDRRSSPLRSEPQPIWFLLLHQVLRQGTASPEGHQWRSMGSLRGCVARSRCRRCGWWCRVRWNVPRPWMREACRGMIRPAWWVGTEPSFDCTTNRALAPLGKSETTIVCWRIYEYDMSHHVHVDIELWTHMHADKWHTTQVHVDIWHTTHVHADIWNTTHVHVPTYEIRHMCMPTYDIRHIMPTYDIRHMCMLTYDIRHMRMLTYDICYRYMPTCDIRHIYACGHM